MPDLDYRFDKYTEKYQADELERIREFARSESLPERVTLEVGTNRGRLLRALAERHPDRYFLGVEWTQSLCETAQRRLERAGVVNADVLCADARHVLPVVIDAGQLDEVFVFYPDPWWKRRHRKRRIIQPTFVDLLADKMGPDGKLWIRTDVGPFADDMREVLDDHPSFRPVDIFEAPMQPFPRSTRERHVISKGIPVHLVYYERIGA